jgi:hypothetical protein
MRHRIGHALEHISPDRRTGEVNHARDAAHQT